MPSKKNWKQILLDKNKQNNAIILSILDDKLRLETKIKFICNCGNEYSKTCRMIAERIGFFCKKCTFNKSLTNRKKNNLKKYGTEFPHQSKIVKEKIKQTNLKKYGVENVSQAEKFKQKKEKQQ